MDNIFSWVVLSGGAWFVIIKTIINYIKEV